MLQDMMLHPQEHHQLFNEEMPSPLNDQILNFCESELFSELQNSDVASSSNGCCYDEQSSYNNNTNTNFDLNKFQNTNEKNDETITKRTTSTTTDVSRSGPCPANIDDNNNNNHNNNNDNMSMIFDAEDDISASIDFTPTANFTVPDHFLQQQEEQFDIIPLNNHPGPDISLPQPHVMTLMGPPLGHSYEGESLSSVPPYMRGLASTSTSPSCVLLDPNVVNYLQGNLNNTMNSEVSTMFAAATNSGLFFGSQLPNQESDFQGENGRIFCPDSLPRIYNSELQGLSNESQHLVSGGGCSNTLAIEITSFEDPIHTKTGRCSVEERREKIIRYMKKRNERNFSKKIKYACRKTLADSRPRVRGRFARNDEFGEASKANSCGTIEEDTISHEDERLNNIMYHSNMVVASSTHHHHHDNNGRIFTSICHVSTTSPYDMCTPLYCTDGQMH
ncbi:putative basic-leucine zipper transcription factor E isoform X1 [Capsicum annuum]|uniref:probable basic-leucine zipper transcription factor E isoform X1 n=1 Tax=Capsicum annuum TaxID=4072 RepID=UPI001FB10FB9|nr:probable basic-leucine zipper transcription factor E isoform X1 [Capsicum annuum]XP_016566049.2 probable basic-leucine zipper transcription factor E isoform X1 [Capsicum annuum]